MPVDICCFLTVEKRWFCCHIPIPIASRSHVSYNGQPTTIVFTSAMVPTHIPSPCSVGTDESGAFKELQQILVLILKMMSSEKPRRVS